MAKKKLTIAGLKGRLRTRFFTASWAARTWKTTFTQAYRELRTWEDEGIVDSAPISSDGERKIYRFSKGGK